MQSEELQVKDNSGTSSEKKQIYILDDDESVLRSLKLLMVSYGFAVDTFSSAGQFLKDVPKSAEGCLILDIHMPQFNGWEMLQKLSKTGYSLPIIVITADKDESFKNKALKAGAVGFLQKPFEDHYLLHMVTRIFDKMKI